MPHNLLVTKLYTPAVHANLVARARLLRMLDEAWQQGKKLTLVSAPAGYGKTTLVAQWLAHLAQPVAWISLDEDDNDAVKFLAYVIAAIQPVCSGFGEATLALLQSPQLPSSELLVTRLVNELAAIASHFILVLDDYHTIHAGAIHQQLAFLLEHHPHPLHLVLITREDPLLPIARLRGRGQVLEIRQDDLRFTPQETSDFLHGVMGLSLPAGQIAALERRTEGWIAGLQLAAIALRSPLSLQGRQDLDDFVQAFTGSNRFILDYLIEEVFERQPAEVKAFLLKTCILERMCAALCDAILEWSDSQALLETLEQANMFIVPLDQSRGWYRYHRLFTDVLRHRLRHDRSISEADLHQKATQWFEQNGLMLEALQHALSAQDWPRAADLIAKSIPEMLKRGEVASAIRLFEAFPEEYLLSDPKLCFDYSWPLLLASQYEAAAPMLARAEQAAQSIPAFLGEVAAAQAYLARSLGDHARMIEKSQQALALLPVSSLNSRGLVATNLGLAYWHMGKMQEAEEPLAEALQAGLATGNHYAAVTALIFQGRVMAVRGQLQQAAEHFRHAIRQGRDMPINAIAHIDLSMLHYEWNELSAADDHLQQAMPLCEQSRNGEFLIAAFLMQARLRQGQGNPQAARQALEMARARFQQGDVPAQSAARIASAEVEVAVAQGDLETAQAAASRLEDGTGAHPFYRFLGLDQARLLLAQDRGAAAGRLAQLYALAEQSGWVYAQIATRVLQALAAGSQKAAVEFLSQALDLAHGEGFMRAFVDAGAGLIALLHEAARLGHRPEYIGKLLSALEETQKSPPAWQASLVEPLSEREIEVLRLVIAGMSNREIAKKLFISQGTAKTHVHNICGKLGAQNRTEAAVRARELHLA